MLFAPLCALPQELTQAPGQEQMQEQTQEQMPTSLEEYRRAVSEYSWKLKAAQADSEQAAQELLRTRTSFLPSLSIAGDFSVALSQHDGIKPWTFGLRPEIVCTLYGGGRIRAACDRAKLEHTATLCDEAFTALDVRYAADYAYWNLSAMRQYLDAMRRFVEIIRTLKTVIDRRFAEGYISKGDVLMIDARLSAAKYEELAAERNFEEALHNFNILRGSDADMEVTLSNSILDSLDMPRRVTLDLTLAARPDYTAARLRAQQAETAILSVRASYNPQIALGISGIWQPDSPNRRGATSFDGAVFARLSVPIFHFRERRYAISAARASALHSQWMLAQLHDDILKQERNGWTALNESRTQVDAMRESLRIAGENLDLSTYSYGEGLTTILDVLQAQLSWIQLYTNAITARFNYAVARSSYQRITAGESMQ